MQHKPDTVLDIPGNTVVVGEMSIYWRFVVDISVATESILSVVP